jgi:hypothetical protein
VPRFSSPTTSTQLLYMFLFSLNLSPLTRLGMPAN